MSELIKIHILQCLVHSKAQVPLILGSLLVGPAKPLILRSLLVGPAEYLLPTVQASDF